MFGGSAGSEVPAAGADEACRQMVDQHMIESDERSVAPLDALLPSDMLEHATDIGIAKASLPAERLSTLSVLGGAFICRT